MSDIELNGEERSDIESSEGDEMNNVEPSEREMNLTELSEGEFGEDHASRSCTQDGSNSEQESISKYDYICNDSSSTNFPPSIPHQPFSLPNHSENTPTSFNLPSHPGNGSAALFNLQNHPGNGVLSQPLTIPQEKPAGDDSDNEDEEVEEPQQNQKHKLQVSIKKNKKEDQLQEHSGKGKRNYCGQ